LCFGAKGILEGNFPIPLPHMTEKFHERFNIPFSMDEAKRRFINRAGNEIFRKNEWNRTFHQLLLRAVATTLGEVFLIVKDFRDYIKEDFSNSLQGIEGIYSFLEGVLPNELKGFDTRVQEIINFSEYDLGIRWESGRFYPTGAKLLDDSLVNESLKWLRVKSFQTVFTPFEKALDHLLRARSKPELLADVITDAYEAMEALAKVVTGKDQALDANQDAFLKLICASEEYKQILHESLRKYRSFAHKFRHGAATPEKKPSIGYAEAESFIYLTGLFIRLVISSGFFPATP
jgi:hypothetical protein